MPAMQASFQAAGLQGIGDSAKLNHLTCYTLTFILEHVQCHVFKEKLTFLVGYATNN